MPVHPLDGLSAEEITLVVDILREEQLIGAESRFPYIGLLEPSKAEVLGWQPGTSLARRAQAVVKKGAETYEAAINLDRGLVEGWELIEGVQSSILGEEWATAQELVKADPEWQAGMRARGYEAQSPIFCESYSAGFFGLVDPERRIVNVACYDVADAGNNIYSRPIEGLYAVVDLESRTVVEIIETGLVPVSEATGPSGSVPENTVQDVAAQVGNIAQVKKEGGRVRWNNWAFHVRFDRRLGPIISVVSFQDKGRMRPILYQGSVAEMFVPYMDTDVGWYYRTFMDVGEYGFGRLASKLLPGADCPANAIMQGATLPTETGAAYEAANVLCIFERNTGAPLWRHSESLNATYVGRLDVELVVRSISTVGNYIMWSIGLLLKQVKFGLMSVRPDIQG